MLLFLGLLTPKRLIEHTTSQSLQPEHLSGITVNFLDTTLPPHLLLLDYLSDFTKKKGFVNEFKAALHSNLT
jgi:hypothetical protein